MRYSVTPPLLAQSLVAAAAPPGDYESVAGDLHEEYVKRAALMGVNAANRWYWTQAIASIPSLLSYSRVQRSLWNLLATAAIAGITLLALLLATETLDTVLHGACRGRCPVQIYFTVDWLDAAGFGALLALVARSGGVRFVLSCAVFLVAAIVVPTLLGYSSRLPLAQWLLLFGAVPAMSIGAAIFQIIRTQRKD